jgi:hypothetical protein
MQGALGGVTIGQTIITVIVKMRCEVAGELHVA